MRSVTGSVNPTPPSVAGRKRRNACAMEGGVSVKTRASTPMRLAKASRRSSFVSCATSFVRVVGMLAKWCPNFVDGLNASLMARNVGYTGFPSDVITSRRMRAHSLVCALSSRRVAFAVPT